MMHPKTWPDIPALQEITTPLAVMMTPEEWEEWYQREGKYDGTESVRRTADDRVLPARG